MPERRELNALESQLEEENLARAREIERSRSYYAGSQYDSENEDALREIAQVDRLARRLPEHEKRLAYSTHIQEAIDYIAAQLGGGFQVSASSGEVERIIRETLSNSPALASADDADEINVVPILRDAGIAGDVGVHVRWDVERGVPWLEFWESESVDFQYDPDNRFRLVKVLVSEVAWVPAGDGDLTEVMRVREWFLDEDGQCVVRTWEDDLWVSDEGLGFQFIPWRLWRIQKKEIRQARGESLVNARVRGLADRYDAVEQLSFVIARYNSHGNLAVVGDGALMQANSDGRIRKDVADVLTFPGGTSVVPVTLPSDTALIEHQRSALIDALFSTFGLARIDAETVQGLGALSGYALEILNRKSDGTFDQIRRQLARDIRSTLNVALDLTAAMEDPFADPDVVYPDRKMQIVMGSGYIVDDVMLRDDFVAQLVSRRHVLRQRGLDDEAIDVIEAEIVAEKPKAPEVSLSPAAQAVASPIGSGSTLSNASG